MQQIVDCAPARIAQPLALRRPVRRVHVPPGRQAFHPLRLFPRALRPHRRRETEHDAAERLLHGDLPGLEFRFHGQVSDRFIRHAMQPNHALQRTRRWRLGRLHAFGGRVAELGSLGVATPK